MSRAPHEHGHSDSRVRPSAGAPHSNRRGTSGRAQVQLNLNLKITHPTPSARALTSDAKSPHFESHGHWHAARTCLRPTRGHYTVRG